VLAQGEDIMPIPGTERGTYPEDNLGALDVILTDDDLARIDRILPQGAATGTRYATPQVASLKL
jgi:aryl-alcohol dehydrogenase-like predicted oxidoreductase